MKARESCNFPTANGYARNMRVRESFANPPPFEADFYARTQGPDRGMISAWQAGIRKRREDPAAARLAEAGELPVLPFKGGVARAIKAKKPKIGALAYLAMWQGLRGEDLDIDLHSEPMRTCTRHDVTVVFTADVVKLLAAGSEEQDDIA